MAVSRCEISPALENFHILMQLSVLVDFIEFCHHKKLHDIKQENV